MVKQRKLAGILAFFLMQGVLVDAHASGVFSGLGEVFNSAKESVKGLMDGEETTDTENTPGSKASDADIAPTAADEQRVPNGADMAELQRLLNQLGKTGSYSAGKPDGYFGQQTGQAIQAFQKQQDLSVDGKATYSLLIKARQVAKSTPAKSATSLSRSGGAPAANKAPNFTVSRCVDSSELGEAQLMDGIYKELTADLPIDVRPYLAGFCMPEDKHHLERLYLYLVAQGAAHARLTLIKYDALVEHYSKAGVDLGIRKGAFRRSIETLNSDLRVYAENRREGAEQLLENFDVKEVRQLLDALPAGYMQLEAKYRKEAKVLMGEALTHSISSTFYLTRSTLIGKALLEMVGLDGKSGLSSGMGIGRVWGILKRKGKEWVEGGKIVYFVTNKKDEIKDMLVASTYSIKTFTQDIKEIPTINQEVAEQELAKLREDNGVELEEFEAAFESEQQEQLREAKV